MRRHAGTIIFAIAAVAGLGVLLAFLATALGTTSLTDRVAAATGAATTALALVGGLSAWQNATLVREAGAQATASEALARSTADQAQVSQRLASAARHQARASDELARATNKLVAESQADRELEFRPHVVAELIQSGDHGGRQYRKCVLKNIGRGPAINVALAAHELVATPPRQLFGSTQLIDLAPNEAREEVVYLSADAAGQRFRRLTDGLPDPSLAIGYEDVVGTRYRWVIAGGFRRPVEVRRRTDPTVLDWAAWLG